MRALQIPSSMLKTDQWFLFCFFLPVSCLWQYFVLLAFTVTWVALCEGLDQIFWESSIKQCVLVFLYSIGFFLILERMQLLNRSTLCSIHLVPPTMQKSSVFTYSEGFSFPLFLRSLWVFSDFPVYRISSLVSYAEVVLTNGGIQDQYRMGIFQWRKFSHSLTLLLSLHDLVHSAIASICADAQCSRSEIEKYLAHHSICQHRAMAAGQTQCAAG